MDRPDDKPKPPRREIGNANLFADDIVFSDTEKIFFEEDLKENAPAIVWGFVCLTVSYVPYFPCWGKYMKVC